MTAPQPQPGILGITPYKGGEAAVPGVALRFLFVLHRPCAAIVRDRSRDFRQVTRRYRSRPPEVEDALHILRSTTPTATRTSF